MNSEGMPKHVYETEQFDKAKARAELSAIYHLRFVDSDIALDVPQRFEIGEMPKKNDIESDINDMVAFLNLPMIIDDFSQDDLARRTMKKEIQGTFGDQYAALMEENKLRVGKITIALKTIGYAIRELGLKKEAETVNARVREQLHIRYNDLDLEQKIEYVKTVDSIIIDFLRIVQHTLANKSDLKDK